MGTSAQVVGEPLHLLVGRSMFVNTENRLKRVYVSNPDVLDSFTSSPHQIVITAKAPGLASLVLWDETGQSRAYLINSDIDVADLHHVLKDAFPNENIRVEGHGDQVALAGTVSNTETADAAIKLAGLFSKDVANSLLVEHHTYPAGPPQGPRRGNRPLQSRAARLQLLRARLEQLNVRTGQFGSVTVGANPPTSTSAPTATSSLFSLSSLLNLFYYNSNLQLGAAIQALVDKQIVQILAEPTITALSGEKASFLSGGTFPYPMVEPGVGGVNTVTIVFKDYGVKVDFTPTVLPDGTIDSQGRARSQRPRLHERSRHRRIHDSGHLHPPRRYPRRAEERPELLPSPVCSTTAPPTSWRKIPGIGDIPILGKLFQSKSVNHSAVGAGGYRNAHPRGSAYRQSHAPLSRRRPIPFIDNQKFDKGIAPKTPPPQPQPQPVPQQVPVH